MRTSVYEVIRSSARTCGMHVLNSSSEFLQSKAIYGLALLGSRNDEPKSSFPGAELTGMQ